METKMIFEKTSKLGNEINELKKHLERNNNKCLEMMEICPHEIVFKYNDNYPKKLIIDGSYFCPACGKTIRCIQEDEIKNTVFKDSRIIPLSNLSLFGTTNLYHTIRNEVYKNMNLYYHSDLSNEELSNRMEEVIKDQEIKDKKANKVLRKRIK